MSKLAIDPSGNVVTYPGASLKPGWRWAADVPPPVVAVPPPAPVAPVEEAPAPKPLRVNQRRVRPAAKIEPAPPTDDAWTAPADDGGKDPA